MPKIISSSALRNNYNEVSCWCKETQEPAFVTKNGKGDLAVLSMEAYERMDAKNSFYDFLAKGRRDVERGRTRPAREALRDLREKHGL